MKKKDQTDQTKSFDEFADKYNLVTNHINPDATCDGAWFETCGEELDYVRSMVEKNPKRVWTIVGCDGQLHVVTGYHIVNSIGYLITNEPWESETETYRYND